MGKRILVLEQDAYELLLRKVKDIAVAQLMAPADADESPGDKAAKNLIAAVHGAPVLEMEPTELGAEGDLPMLTFSGGSAEGVEAVKARMLSSLEKYPMELNYSDFCLLLDTLDAAQKHGNPAVSEWAHDFLSSIAATVRVEFI